MNSKTIITVILGLFVIGSVGAIIFSEVNQPTTLKESKEAENLSVLPKVNSGQQVIAYYFHGNARCVTCRKIEAFTEKALKDGFSGPIQEGQLVWKVTNVDEPENTHFIDDYQLHTKSVVLSMVTDGQETEWKNLEQVWQLVGDEESFIEYVQGETRLFLGEGNG